VWTFLKVVAIRTGGCRDSSAEGVATFREAVFKLAAVRTTLFNGATIEFSNAHFLTSGFLDAIQIDCILD